jgi:hypothetical protein
MFILLVSCDSGKNLIAQDTTYRQIIYLPVINISSRSLIGVENEAVSASVLEPYYFGDFVKFSVHWATIEPVSGKYDWSSIDKKAFGNVRFVSVKGAPRWANGNNPVCSPPLVKYWPDYLKMTNAVIDRYDPLWIEIWNEPDTDYSGAEYFFGCWGYDRQAGVDYANFVNYLYPRIKEQYPDLVIMAGSLMNPYNDFAAGFLDNVGEIDGVSFHVYEWCDKSYLLPSFTKKIKSMTDLPVYLSETSLIYITPSMNCERQQAKYFEYLIDQPKLEFSVWYTLGCNSWQNSDMIDCSPFRFKPVYLSYRSIHTNE